MAKTKTQIWDAADYLESREDIAAYLEAALEDGDPALITAALSDIARSKGMAQIADEKGIGQESLHEALSEGNSEFVTVLEIMRSLGLRLTATAA